MFTLCLFLVLIPRLGRIPEQMRMKGASVRAGREPISHPAGSTHRRICIEKQNILLGLEEAAAVAMVLDASAAGGREQGPHFARLSVFTRAPAWINAGHPGFLLFYSCKHITHLLEQARQPRYIKKKLTHPIPPLPHYPSHTFPSTPLL